MTQPEGPEQGQGWTRRDFAGGAALLAMALGLPVAAIRLQSLPADAVPTPDQRRLLREVSQLVLPRTDTPGAGDVGTGDFVALALAHGLEESHRPLPADAPGSQTRHRRPDGTLDHLGWLESELDRRVQPGFLKAPAEARQAGLAALDAEAFAEGVEQHPWRTIKALVLTGYYTSQAGGAEELRYELVPGRFDADLPLRPGDRAFSSDWTAVDFG